MLACNKRMDFSPFRNNNLVFKQTRLKASFASVACQELFATASKTAKSMSQLSFLPPALILLTNRDQALR